MEEGRRAHSRSSFMRNALLAVATAFLALGTCGGPLIARLYFLHGGSRIWLSSFLQTAGFPLLLIPLLACYYNRRRTQGGGAAAFLLSRPRTVAAATIMGLITGLGDYFYSYGVEKLPVSTSSLIVASQLVFTAAFAFLLVKQRFTAFSVNAVVLLTIAAVVLAARSNGDRPEGESSKAYYKGFAMTVVAAAQTGLVLPLIEMTYQKAKQEVTYGLVMEIQFVLCFSATALCTIGMLVNHDFQAITREAKAYELGESRYYVVLVFTAIIWQLFFVGATAIIFCSSSLLSGILIAVLLPVTEVLSVLFYKERFAAEKGIALALSLWGLASYFYGEYKNAKRNDTNDDQTPQSTQTQLSTQTPTNTTLPA